MRVGRVEGKWILNPTFQQLEFSDMDLVVAGSTDSIVMVEGGALEVSEAEVVEALKVAQKGIQELIGDAGRAARARPGSPRWRGRRPSRRPTLAARVKELAEKPIAEAINQQGQGRRASQAVEA